MRGFLDLARSAWPSTLLAIVGHISALWWLFVIAAGLFGIAGFYEQVLFGVALVCLLVGVLGGLATYRKSEWAARRSGDMNALIRSEGKEVLKRRRRGVQPTEAVDDVLGVAIECGQQPVMLPLAPKEPEMGHFFYIHDVLMTNRTPAPVSLVPCLVIDLLDGNHAVLDQKGFKLFPKGFTASEMLLHGPLDIDPSRSLRGDLGFTLMGSEEKILFGADFNRNVKRVGTGLPVMYLVLRDLVSGKEIAQEVTHRHMRSSVGSLAELQERNRRVPQPVPPMTTTEAIADLIMEARAMRERIDTFGYHTSEDHFTLAWEAEAWAKRVSRFLEKYSPELRNLFRRPQVSVEAQHVASYLEGGMAELKDIQGRHSEKSFPASEFDDFRPKPDEWMGEED